VGRHWELSTHCRARWRLSTLMTWRWVGSGQALINVGDVAAMSCPVWQGNSPGVCAMQAQWALVIVVSSDGAAGR